VTLLIIEAAMEGLTKDSFLKTWYESSGYPSYFFDNVKVPKRTDG
jgi:hypothetical protein